MPLYGIADVRVRVKDGKKTLAVFTTDNEGACMCKHACIRESVESVDLFPVCKLLNHTHGALVVLFLLLRLALSCLALTGRGSDCCG